jgi:non-ribosomal peptide synthetase component E (peptide arylation enzyme)
LEAEKKLPGVVINGFGSVDSGAQFINSPHAPLDVRLLTVGQPLAGNKVRILDENGHEAARGEVGELYLGGSLVSSGYYRDPEGTWQVWTKDGWFKTGDLGKLDEEGNLIIAGRKKDMIIRGGQNIYPVEIENLLQAHPKVADVAIVAMPDPIMGEKACAYVVPKWGQTFTFDEMVSYMKSKNIVAYKLPERLEVVESLPVVGDQKIDKKLLRQQILEKLQAEGKV